MATGILTIVEGIKSNKEAIEALGTRICSVMMVVAGNLQGKSQNEIPGDFKENVDRLAQDLAKIRIAVEEISKEANGHGVRGRLKQTFGHKSIGDAIKQCTTQLDWAVDLFKIQDHVQNALKVDSIHTGVADLECGQARVREMQLLAHAMLAGMQQEQSEMHAGMKDMQYTVREVAAAVKNLEPRTSTSLPTSVPPPQPHLIYGRDEDLNTLVHRILSMPASRLAILGTGGIGKTTVASALIHHLAVVHYFGPRRYWASCETATTVPMLLDILAGALGIVKPSSDRLRDVHDFLLTLNQPSLLILDNFETPLDIPQCRSNVIDTLRTLFDNPNLVVILTMRGTLPGVGKLGWSKPPLAEIGVLSPDAAKKLYVEIHPDAEGDGSLDTLLSELGFLPLAIQLMATTGSFGESPSDLLIRWREEGVEVVDQPDGDKGTSLERSIEMSLKSNLIQSSPEAIQLLSIISKLPGGVRSETLKDLVPSLTKVVNLRNALLQASLIYTEDNGKSYQVRPPIRAYMIRRYPPSTILLSGIHNFYVNLVLDHQVRPNSSYSANVTMLLLEDVNLETVFLEMLKDPSATTLEAARQYAYFQYCTRPRLEIITTTIASCRKQHDEVNLFNALRYMGFMHVALAQYDDAIAAYIEAKEIASRLNDKAIVSRLLVDIGDIDRNQGRPKEARAAFEEAQATFEELKHLAGIAACLRSMAAINVDLSHYDDARIGLQKAVDLFKGVDDIIQAAYCELDLAETDIRLGNYDIARTSLVELQKKYREWGDQRGLAGATRCLGQVNRFQGRFQDAEEHYRTAMKIYKAMNDNLEVARCNQALGWVQQESGQLGEARKLIDEARRQFELIGHIDEVADCLLSLADIDVEEGEVEAARSKLVKACEIYRTIEGAGGLERTLAKIEQLRD